MPTRLLPGQRKKIPLLSFNITFSLPYSVSCDELFVNDFVAVCGNMGKSPHKRLKEIFFEICGFKSEEEFKKSSKKQKKLLYDYYEKLIEKTNNTSGITENMRNIMQKDIDNNTGVKL